MVALDSSNQDEVGKTVAIIVGVLAGLAVLIVLLSICRKSMGKYLRKLFFTRTITTKKKVVIAYVTDSGFLACRLRKR